jgi:TonB-linked SusC/RagA family outer membrane protein
MQKICNLLCNAQRRWEKTFRIMKLTTGLLLFAMFTATAAKSYSQTARLSLNMKDATIVDIFREIERTSEFGFFFKSEELNNEKRQSIKVTDATIDEVLKKVLDSNYSYKILDKNIVVTKGNLEATQQQGKKVTGKVTDSSGASLPGVSVVVKGTTIGVITDIDGFYSMSNIPENAVLQYSFVGMKTQETIVGVQATINVALAEETVGIEEVVAIGYGTSKKATVTGSIITAKGDQLKSSATTNFANMLAGRLPGLVAVNPSGEPGNDTPILRIRGGNTLGDNSALVVIDGITGRDMTGLDPTDIESISVLKDASAAIYGARAANGVILITTKRGKIGKPEVNVDLNYGFSSPTVTPRMADAATYATMLNEIDIYSGKTPGYTTEEIQKFKDGSDPWRYPNTDWFSAVFKSSTPQSKGDVSIRGGNENMSYFISTGFNFQDAIYKNSDAKYSQVNFRTNIDGKISKDIHLSFDLSGRQEDRNFASNPFDYCNYSGSFLIKKCVRQEFLFSS